MKAIILAAGRSTRLYPLTLDKPKCLLKIVNKTLIEHQLSILRACGIEDIVVVTGYLSSLIKDTLGSKVRYRHYEDFAKTNNLYTLYSVNMELTDDVIILFSDVLITTSLLKRCVESEKDFRLIIDRKNITDKTMRVKINDFSIYDIGNHIPYYEGDGNFIGIAGFSKKGAQILSQQIEESVKDKTNNLQDYYTIVLVEIAKKGYLIDIVEINDEVWIEIDYKEDYDKAINLFGHKIF